MSDDTITIRKSSGWNLSYLESPSGPCEIKIWWDGPKADHPMEDLLWSCGCCGGAQSNIDMPHALTLYKALLRTLHRKFPLGPPRD